MTVLLLVALAVVFAFLAIRARRLITSALWLAGVSALCALVFSLYGARQVAVIELSVGAGLVTVLFVFAISVAGDEPLAGRPVLPRPLSAGLVLLWMLVLGGMLLPGLPIPPAVPPDRAGLAEVLWGPRGLDALLQVVVIFAGVLGLLGLLAESGAPLDGAVAREVAAGRERDLQALTEQLQDGEAVPE
ncbi:MAG: hypothetical protein JXB85_01635 [Anaerolineales bacterium]|nr:hypothetical protein [Anaerolineales bacterium]